jgi:protein-S-isoprenylcysteine O-methyltransferase Ste14
MADTPPIPLRLARALLATACEALLLAWGLGGLDALWASKRALALLAIWFVSGAVLTVTRPVRGQAVAKAERDVVAMLVLALVPLAIPSLAAYGGRIALWPLPWPDALGNLGVLLSGLGLALRIAAMRQLGARFSPLVAVQHEHTLETTGWYARVRHPGYSGALLASLGAAITFGSALALPLVGLMLLAQLARIRREEALLAAHFGQAWRDYAARTGALVPGLGRSRP